MKLFLLIIFVLELQAQIILNKPDYFTGGGEPPNTIVDDDGDDVPILGIEFHLEQYDTAASGSDQWVTTWGGNGNLYTAWGDGGGFGGNNTVGRSASGIARVTGENFLTATKKNINGGLNPESGNEQWADASNNKISGMLCIGDSTLYAWLTGDGGTLGYHDSTVLWKSTNGGYTWTRLPVKWDKVNDFGDAYPVLVNYNFVQYDSGHTVGRGDNYVYAIAIEADEASQSVYKPGNLFLLRAHKDSLEVKANWWFFTGMDGSNPTWGTLANREAILTSADGFFQPAITFNYLFKRYILTSMQKDWRRTDSSVVSFYDCDLLWGSWNRFHSANSWKESGGAWNYGIWELVPNLPGKWMESDSTAVIINDSHADNWGAVKVTFHSTPQTPDTLAGILKGDTFNRANSTNLNASNTGKTPAGATWSWAETNGDWSVNTNGLRAGTDDAIAKCDTTLGSVSMWSKVWAQNLPATGGYSVGVATNIDNDTTKYYSFQMWGTSERQYTLKKYSAAGTSSSLIPLTDITQAAPFTMKMRSYYVDASHLFLIIFVNDLAIGRIKDTSPLIGIRAGATDDFGSDFAGGFINEWQGRGE